MLSNILDKVSFFALFFTMLLLPIFIIPFTSVPTETGKGIVFVLGLAISLIFWAASRFSTGKISIPNSKIILAVLFVSLVSFLSAIFSKSINISLFGVVLDIGSFWYIFSLSMLLIVSSFVINNEKKGRFILKGLLISSIIVFVFQIVRFFIPNMLALGFFTDKTSNLLGSWNSLAIFAGLITLISLFLIEFNKFSKKHKIILNLLILVSLFIIISVNYSLVWQLLGIFSLVVFVFKLSSNSILNKDENHKTNFPLYSFGIIIICLFFFMSSRFIGSLVPDLLGLVNVEVNPSFSTTLDITKNVIKENPVLGIGPNKFNQAWSLYKPLIINQSQFWNTSFVSGFGTIPTFMATTGVLGILSWVLFVFLFIFESLKRISLFIKNKYSNDVVLYFIIILYLLVASILYPVANTLLLIMFIFIGMNIGIMSNKLNLNLDFNFLEDPRKSFFAILSLVIVMILSAGLVFKYSEKFISVFYFSKALTANDISTAERSISKALILNQNDLYFRTASQVYLSKINITISENENISDENKVVIQNSINQAITLALSAVEKNPNNYLNHELLGFAYRNALSLGIEDTSQKSIEAYTKASQLNPNNPLLKLEIARVYFLEKKIKEARDNALISIELKPDFIQGLIFLAQVEELEGNNRVAISYTEKALAIFPTDQSLIDYLQNLKNKISTPILNTETESSN